MTDARRQVLARLPSIEWFQVSDDPTGVRRVSYARYSTDYGLVQLECRLNYRPVSNQKILVPGQQASHVQVEAHFLISCMLPVLRQVKVDDEWYIQAYPDVQQAIQKGIVLDA